MRLLCNFILQFHLIYPVPPAFNRHVLSYTVNAAVDFRDHFASSESELRTATSTVHFAQIKVRVFLGPTK